MLALIAMEKPVSGNADDIRDEKVKVIRCISPAMPEGCVLGQYAAANGKPGYHDDDTVPKDSKAPTFATIVLNVHNERCDTLTRLQGYTLGQDCGNGFTVLCTAQASMDIMLAYLHGGFAVPCCCQVYAAACS